MSVHSLCKLHVYSYVSVMDVYKHTHTHYYVYIYTPYTRVNKRNSLLSAYSLLASFWVLHLDNKRKVTVVYL